jgi:hypothetical protein
MKRYIQDDSYFKIINDERKSYWLGFLYADGCVYKKSENNGEVIIQLKPDDRNILEEFLKDIKSDRHVHVNKKGYVSICISSTEMVNDLIKLGCVPRKSLVLQFPSKKIVPQYLLSHFIRGYMDGDGCISTYYKRKKGRITAILTCEIKFIGTYSMLNGIREFFKSEKNLLINKHSPATYQLSFSGTKYREAVNSLYDNAVIYMERKKVKWDEYTTYLNNKNREKENKLNKKIVKLDRDANYAGTYTIQELKENFNISSIIKCCKEGNQKYHKNFFWIYLEDYNNYLENKINIRTILECKEKHNDKRQKIDKTIEQYDLNGNFIDTWKAAKIAAEYYDTTAKAIRKVCTGERKSCCNFIWKYTKAGKTKKSKAVEQYDIKGKLVKEWSNLREAAIFYDVTFQAIERAISGKYKTCCGFVWAYRK